VTETLGGIKKESRGQGLGRYRGEARGDKASIRSTIIDKGKKRELLSIATNVGRKERPKRRYLKIERKKKKGRNYETLVVRKQGGAIHSRINSRIRWKGLYRRQTNEEGHLALC